MRRSLPRRSVRTAGALTIAFTLAGAATAVPAYAAAGPDLKVTATAPEGHWLPSDYVPIDLTITNVGDTTAEEVRASLERVSGTLFTINQDSWGELYEGGSGTSIAAGASRTYHLNGVVDHSRSGDPVLRIKASGSAEANEADNSSVVTVPLVPAGTTDRVAGHLYADANGDGLPSPGEDLAGVEAELLALDTSAVLTATTDVNGRFVFDNTPLSRTALLQFRNVPPQWVTPRFNDLRLDGSGRHSAMEVRTARSLWESLQAGITVDKTSYAAGDNGTATVTLTNTSDKAIKGLFARCDPSGSGTELDIAPAAWGAFSPQAKNGTLAPRQTLTIKATGKVPDKAAAFGTTGLSCYFDNETSYDSGPYAFALAKVPGQRADSRGQVWTDKNGNGQLDAGEGLPKTKVVLTTDGTNIVAFGQTDANGLVTFANVPVGPYQFRTVGPTWLPSGNAGVWVTAPPYNVGEWQITVVRR